MANNEKLRVFTTFSGYDSQCLALKYAGIDFDLVGWSEIDKSAITAHNALFPEYADRNFGDVSKIDWSKVEDFDLLTYSSPCQDISQAGQQRGLSKDSGTRSSLLLQVEKAIIEKKPKYLLMENVAALVSDKFINDFKGWLDTLAEYGYKSSYQVLNAKDYGVPQNRQRVFVVSTLNADAFYFPKTKKLQQKLSDVLEDSVDERYFLNVDIQSYLDDEKGKCEELNNSTDDLGGQLRTNVVRMFDTRHQTISEIALCLTCQTDKCAQQFIIIPNENNETKDDGNHKKKEDLGGAVH